MKAWGRGHTWHAHRPERFRWQLAAGQAQVLQHPGTAEEALQRGGRCSGLPALGVGRKGEVRFRLLELISRTFCLPGLRGAPYAREKIFLEASRWVRLEQQPPDKAAKSWE